MKKFWLEIPKKSSVRLEKHAMQIVFCCFLVIAFTIFSFYSRLTGWLFSEHKIDIFNDLEQISRYFWVIDPETAEQIITLDTIIKDYLAGENVLQARALELEQLWLFVKDNGNALTRLGFGNYEKIFQMLTVARPMREEIFELLWKNQRFNYLIPLQNSNEARPNGGFFWSFAFVGLSGGHIVDMQIVDSYLPDLLAPHARIMLPEWTQGFLTERRAGFIAGNKYWFTDLDGKNLKTLYEQIFHYDFDPQKKEQMFNPQKWNQLFQKNIKGVIFLDSELISYLIPSFRSKAWEWQFLNANVDLIRGEDRSNKKEFYIKGLESYLQNNALTLAKSAINGVQEFLNKGFVNIYLSNVSDDLRGFLQAYDLTNVYDPAFLYFFNINRSFNKSDGFVNKQVEVLDSNGKVILATDERKLNITTLKPWKYTLSFRYALDVPKTYQDEMFALEKKLGIQMSNRERHILVLQAINNDPSQPPRWRETREVIYFPKGTKILNLEGDFFNEKIFESDFAQALSYQSRIGENKTTNAVKVEIQLF